MTIDPYAIMIMYEPLALLASLFTAILIAVSFSVLAQQQPQDITTATTQQQSSPQSYLMMDEEGNKVLVRSL
jgi:hypothetical protein